MKIVSLVMFFLLLCQNSFCQEKIVSIKNRVSNKEITLKENKRIKVVTKTGEKFAGRFMVLDQNSIAVDGVVLALNEIAIIKRHALFVTIIIKANFFHTGTVAFVLSAILGGLPLLIVGSAILVVGVYGGHKLPKSSIAYKAENNWLFKIKGLPETKVTSGIMPIRQFSYE